MNPDLNSSLDLPDENLGAALRSYLDAPDTADFVARVKAALPSRQATSWDILAAWSRPVLAAAAIVLLALGALLTMPRQTGTMNEPLLELGSTADREMVATAMIREP